MNGRVKQRGFVLITSLIFLMILTLLVVSAIRAGNTNLRIAQNMQQKEEVIAAAQEAVEQVISTNFTINPAATLTTVPIDVNKDGNTDYTVNVTTPTCLRATSLVNSTPNLPTECLSSGVASNTGIVSAGSGTPSGAAVSWCEEQVWDVQAGVADARTGAAVTLHQGVGIRVPKGTTC